jgi:hypothetical protein
MNYAVLGFAAGIAATVLFFHYFSSVYSFGKAIYTAADKRVVVADAAVKKAVNDIKNAARAI